MLDERCFELSSRTPFRDRLWKSSWRPAGAIGSIAVLFAIALLSACTDYVSKIDDQIAELKADEPIVLSSSNVTPPMNSSSSSITQKSSSSVAIPVSSSSAVIRSSSSSKVTEPAEVTIGSITDSRDGQSYKTVSIGTQTWMAQNLNYETANSYCYSNTPSNCTKYGRLYTWAASTSACPTGWHLPTKAEFETLLAAVGGQSDAGRKLKSVNSWFKNGNGTDDYSFTAFPAGDRDNKVMGQKTYFWSSSDEGNDAYNLGLLYSYDDAFLFITSKNNGYSVRCIRDESSREKSSSSVVSSSSSVVKSSSSNGNIALSSSSVILGNFVDKRDNQAYKIVTINTQIWMAENLNYEIAKSYCFNDNTSNCTKYGRLYTWAASTSACPTGWHLPTKDEFEKLFSAISGGQSFAGKKLKSTSGWNNGGSGSDDYMFAALSAGYRDEEGLYKENYTCYWSSSEGAGFGAYYMSLSSFDDDAKLDYHGKLFACSVRCVKD